MLVPITSDRIADAVALLAEGFPERNSQFWQSSLARVLDWPGNRLADYPAGFLWVEQSEPVGILLTPASPRSGADGPVLVNVSSWYLRAAFRWKAPLMLRALFRDGRAVFTDLTPTPDVRAMLPAFGFREINPGIVLRLTPALALGRGNGASVVPWQPDVPLPQGSPPAEIIAFHRDLGCATLVIRHGTDNQLCVFRPFRYRGLKAARAVYIGSHAALAGSWPAIARRLLGKGFLIVQSDIRPGCPSPLGFRPHGQWFAKGGAFDDRTDHLGSELCLFDL